MSVSSQRDMVLARIGVLFFGLLIFIFGLPLVVNHFWSSTEHDTTQTFVAQAQAKEVVEERTLTAKVYDLGDGERRMDVYTKPIHYIDSSGVFQNIDTTIKRVDLDGYAFGVRDGLYHAFFTETYAEENTVKVVLENGQDVYVSSDALALLDASGQMVGTVSGPQAVRGMVSDNTIIYEDAYGEGVNVEMRYENSALRREIVIDSFETLGIDANADAAYVDLGFSFAVTLPENAQVAFDGQDWDGVPATTGSRVNIVSDTGEQYFYFEAPIGLDESERPPQSLTYRLSMVEGQLFVQKLLPINWLAQTEGRIRADDSISEFASSDGYVGKWGSGYTSQQSASVGTAAYTNGTYGSVGQWRNGSTYYIWRAYFSFDTSAIPDDATVSAADINLMGRSAFNRGSWNVTVVDWTGGTALSTADYGQVGSTSRGAMANSSWGEESYNTISLSTSVVDLTGDTDLAVRSSDDINARSPGSSDYLRSYFIENSGTSKDPYLSVTYSTAPANTAPTASFRTQPAQSSGTRVSLQIDPSDSDGDTISIALEYSSDGIVYSNATLTNNTKGTIVGNTITGLTGSNVRFDWDIGTDLGNVEGSGYYMRVTPNDGTEDGTTVVSNRFSIDRLAPNPAPGSLTLDSVSETQATFNFGSQASDTNPSDYDVFHIPGSSPPTQLDNEVTGVAAFSAFDYNSQSSFTVSGFGTGTQHTINIWANDDYGFSSSGTSPLTFFMLPESGSLAVTASPTNANALSVSVRPGGNPTGSSIDYEICQTADRGTSCANNLQVGGALTSAAAAQQNYTELGGANGFDMDISAITPSANTQYDFMVRALTSDATASQNYSTLTSVVTLANQVTDLGVTNETDKDGFGLELSWTDNGQTGIQIQKDNGCNGSYDEVLLNTPASTPNTETLSVTSNLSGNTCYQFQACSYNSAGTLNLDSCPTVQVTMAPAASTPSITAASTNSLTLSWSAAAGANEYAIYNANSHNRLAVTDQTTYQMTSLGASARYDFYLRASSTNNGLGPSSGQVAGFTNAEAVTNVRITDVGYRHLEVRWDDGGQAEFYVQDKNNTSDNSGWMTDTSHTFNGLNANQAYTFEVKAKNGADVETGVVEITGYTKQPTPGGITFSNVGPNGVTIAPQGTFTNIGSGSAGIGFQNTDAGTNQNITSGSSWTESSLTPATSYEYCVSVTNINGDATDQICDTVNTLAAEPLPPVPSQKNADSILLDLRLNGNPATTPMSIYDSLSGTYLNTDGTLGASSETWVTLDQWGSPRVSSLTENERYCLIMKMKNADDVETDATDATCTWSGVGDDKELVNTTASPTITVDPSRLTVVLDETNDNTTGNLSSVVVPTDVDDTTRVLMNFKRIAQSDTATTGPQAMTLRRQSDSAKNNIDMIIPAATEITCDQSGWQDFTVPTIVDNSSVTLPANGDTERTVKKVVEIGVDGADCDFSRPVKIVFPEQAGKQAFSIDNSDTVTIIEDVCSNATDPSVDADSACYIDSGDDLVVFTRHATEYGAFDESGEEEAEESSSGGGGGGGGGGYTPPPPAALSGILIDGAASAVTTGQTITITPVDVAENAVEIALSLDPSFAGANWEMYTDAAFFTLPEDDGSYTVYAKIRTIAGVESGVVSATVVKQSSPAPIEPPTITSPTTGSVIDTLPFSVSGVGIPGATVDILVAGTLYSVTADEAGAFSITVLDQLVAGTYTISVLQTDINGVASEAAVTEVTYDAGEEATPSQPVEQSEEESVTEEPTQDGIEETEAPEAGDSSAQEVSDPDVTDESVSLLPPAQQVPHTPAQPVSSVQKIVSPNVRSIHVETTVTADAVDALVDRAASRSSFLVVLQDGISGFHAQQLQTVDAFAGEQVDILLRPSVEVKSITARLYEGTRVTNVETLSFTERIRTWLTPTARAAVASERAWVSGYTFYYDESHNAYRGEIALPAGQTGPHELVISINGSDGSQTQLTKKVNIAPQGTVLGRKNARLSGARVTLFAQRPDGSYAPWQATSYGQENPQITDDAGEYIFRVPVGAYYMTVEAEGYHTYQGGVVVADAPMTMNTAVTLEQKDRSLWQRFWDWFTDLIRRIF